MPPRRPGTRRSPFVTLEEQIAERVAQMRFEDIDADLLHVLKRNILDSYAGICGSLADIGMLRSFDRLAADPFGR